MSWEEAAQRQVLCVVLHTETTSIQWALNLRQLLIPGGIIAMTGMPFDHGRNAGCMAALDGGFQFVYFLDSDVAPPADAVLRLLRHNLPVVSGVYHRRSPPHGVPVMQKPAGNWVLRYPPNRLIEVDTVGSGCLLIRRDVLERLSPSAPGKHWFHWRVDMRGSGVYPDKDCMSEDFVFALRVKRELGIPILVDTGVQCGHLGLAEARYASLLPANGQLTA